MQSMGIASLHPSYALQSAAGSCPHSNPLNGQSTDQSGHAALRGAGMLQEAVEPAVASWPAVARQSDDEAFDCHEHWFLSARKEPMIIAVEPNELSASDLAGHIAACRNTHGPVVPAVQHQCGHGNP